ncbi:MAG: polyprenyl diphosphate synthase [Desulfovibrionales bacterium]
MPSAKQPAHLAIIMDGNGRWAKSKGLPRSEGHRAGTRAAKKIVTHCRKLNIRHLTLYTFSRENWRRPKEEVSFLFDLLRVFLKSELDSLLEQGIRLNVLGELEGLPRVTRAVVEQVRSKTAANSEMNLNLALNYSGRYEIIRACRKLISDGVDPREVDEDLFAEYLYTSGQPDPDLVIRTSGEKRLSNYLLFQAAYAELYFAPDLWPDFGPDELDKALEDFAHRQRRFGDI